METQFVTTLKFFFTKFQENPFQFLTERDIQSSLYCLLLEQAQYKTPVPLKTSLFKNKGGPKEVYLPQVTTEYHYFFKDPITGNSVYSSNQRMDIAIINTEEKTTIDVINRPENANGLFINESLWIQPVKIGIELTLTPPFQYPDLSKINYDLDKLKKYYYKYSEHKTLKGIAISFCYTDPVLKGNDFKEINFTDFENSFSNEIDYYSFIVMKSKIYRGILKL